MWPVRGPAPEPEKPPSLLQPRRQSPSQDYSSHKTSRKLACKRRDKGKPLLPASGKCPSGNAFKKNAHRFQSLLREAGRSQKSSNGKSRKVSKPQELRARTEIRQPIAIRWAPRGQLRVVLTSSYSVFLPV